MDPAELARRVAFWHARRAWVEDMTPHDLHRLARLDTLIAALERCLARAA